MTTFVYVGGWDCDIEDVRHWITEGVDPDATYTGTFEATADWLFCDPDGYDCGDPDATYWLVSETGEIVSAIFV
jgi:hypothetical protein